MTIRLNGSNSGYVQLDAPATAGSNTLVLPTGNGNADQALVTNGSGTLSFADRGRIVQGTAQNSTSGTSVDFTGIPSWVKRVTVMFSGVSTNGTSNPTPRVQIGAGSIDTSGYLGSATHIGTAVTANTFTSGFDFIDGSGPQAASYTRHGSLFLTLLTSNTWTASGMLGLSDTGRLYLLAGSKTLSGTLDRIRITTANGTDTFDAGTINIMYEG